MRDTCSLLTGELMHLLYTTEHFIYYYSILGHTIATASPTSNSYFYSATKHSVTALTEGVRRELRAMKSNVRVTVSKQLCVVQAL